LFRTDIQRGHRVVRVRAGQVELAFDHGHIVAGERRVPVCELEIELLRGAPGAVIDVARRWVAKHGLWLEVRSKAERGERLARGDSAPELRKAAPLHLETALTANAAFRAIVANCLDHLLPNASEVASGDYLEEHIHQWRVGLRRLRTALRFFEGWTPLIDPAWPVALAQVFEQLGTARDRDALTAAVVPDLRGAGAPWVDLPSLQDAGDPVALARSGPFTQTLLDLLGMVAGGDSAGATAGVADFPSLARQRLDAWQRQVRRDAKRFADLDDSARHRLRRRVKRLRYAAEFVASLHPPKAVARYLKALEPVQDSLGRTNDVNVALALYRSLVDAHPAAWFAVGRLSARREALLIETASALKAFNRAEPFWRVSR
jgi:inorganic triphosphatase YgiF